MGIETPNERNFRLLRKRFKLQDEVDQYAKPYSVLRFDVNENSLFIINGNEEHRLFENEKLTPIRNENGILVGFGIGNELVLENENGIQFGNEKEFENELRFGNENENRNENENELGNELKNETLTLSRNENESRNENLVQVLLQFVKSVLHIR